MDKPHWPWEKLLQTGFSMFVAVVLLYYTVNMGSQISLTMDRLQQTLTRLEYQCQRGGPGR